MLALRATGVAHRTVSGLRTPDRGFADDLVLCTDTAEGMNQLLIVVADFCRWSGMRAKLEKTVATAFDFLRRQELSTEGVLYQAPLCISRRGRAFHTLGCEVASWAAPSAALGADNGEQDPRHISRQRSLTSSLPPSWWGSQSTTTSYWVRWFLPCRWWRQLASATQRLLCRGQMRSWTVYIRSGSKYTDLSLNAWICLGALRVP
jgi:hypothetical protein